MLPKCSGFKTGQIKYKNVSLNSGHFSNLPSLFARERFKKMCLNLCFSSSKRKGTYLRLHIVVTGFHRKPCHGGSISSSSSYSSIRNAGFEETVNAADLVRNCNLPVGTA